MISFVPKEPSDPRTDRDPVTSKCGWVVIFAKAGTLSVLFNAPEITNSNFPIFCFLLSHEQQISSAPVTRLRFTFSVTKKTVSEHGSPTGPSRSRKARIERSFHKLVFPRYRTQRNATQRNDAKQNSTKQNEKRWFRFESDGWLRRRWWPQPRRRFFPSFGAVGAAVAADITIIITIPTTIGTTTNRTTTTRGIGTPRPRPTTRRAITAMMITIITRAATIPSVRAFVVFGVDAFELIC